MRKTQFEFFPKEKVTQLQDAFIYLLLFGTFGAHQFYLGNKKRAYYLLGTFGLSYLMIIFMPWIFPALKSNLGVTAALTTTLTGYALGIWDFITLLGQVRDKKSQAKLICCEWFFLPVRK